MPMTTARVSLTLTIILVPSLAFAECVRVSLRDNIRPAAVAFSGTATNIVTNAASEWPGTIVTFDVDRVWKGSVTRRFVVYSFTRTPEGTSFTAGKKYMVFAHSPTTQENDDLRLNTTQAFVVGQCGDGTREFMLVRAADLAELGAGNAPIR
jgi:hypothetical protein